MSKEINGTYKVAVVLSINNSERVLGQNLLLFLQ